MTKYIMTAIHYDGSKVTHEFEKDTINEVLEGTQMFLKGVGFVFDGELDIVNDHYQDPNIDIEPVDFTWNDDIGHSNYFFDTERNK